MTFTFFQDVAEKIGASMSQGIAYDVTAIVIFIIVAFTFLFPINT